jgi:glycosyltransferase involved in cell wall biosynthesis
LFTTKKIAALSVINDLVTDSRVNKTCLALVEAGYEVVLIGRKLPASLPLPAWPFNSIRMKFLFNQGPLFYFFFMARLFFKLLFRKADLLVANDLDTLLPNFLVARLKNIPLIYDSHELFCEVPELQRTPLKRRLWLKLEGWMVPKLKHAITVNDSIARIFSEKYKVPFTVVKNIPARVEGFQPRTKAALNLPANKKIILLQGAGINIDRGAEELVAAMKGVDGALLLIIGSGDCWPLLQSRVTELGLREKVRLIEKLPKTELMHYTYNADLGISIDKNTNPNYYNSLPNKVFDYLHAGVPILASRLPEIEAIVTRFEVGEFIESHEPQHIATRLTELLASPRLAVYKANTSKVEKELNWKTEKQKLMTVIHAAK